MLHLREWAAGASFRAPVQAIVASPLRVGCISAKHEVLALIKTLARKDRSQHEREGGVTPVRALPTVADRSEPLLT